MFTPDKNDVRRFFCHTFTAPIEELSPLELLARNWINQHPEYHVYLANHTKASTLEFPPESLQTNPFLHLSMHLSLSEQISINSPRGIKEIFQLLNQTNDEHHAQHLMMDALAEMIWVAQRNQKNFSEDDYLENLRKLI